MQLLLLAVVASVRVVVLFDFVVAAVRVRVRVVVVALAVVVAFVLLHLAAVTTIVKKFRGCLRSIHEILLVDSMRPDVFVQPFRKCMRCVFLAGVSSMKPGL